MNEFDFFRTAKKSFVPRTPAAALKACEAKILPIEAFIYRGTSIKPLNEEPYNLDEIERVLSKEDLDIQTNLLLMRILKKLVKSKEPETALFASESINLLENRYTNKIENLKQELHIKQKIKAGPDLDTNKELSGEEKSFPAPDNLRIKNISTILRKLAQLYYELSMLYGDTISIKKFYLKEAYNYINKIKTDKKTKKKDVELIVRILCDLKLYDQAMNILEKHREDGISLYLLLEAEIEFKRKNYNKIFEICTKLIKYEDAPDESEKRIISYWLGQ